MAAQKKLSRMGLRVEALMTLEEMLAVVPEDMNSGDPGKDLHDCEADDYTLADGIMAFDDQPGARLKPELMRRARRDEIAYFKEMEVYEKVPIEECWKETGKGPIAARWVNINKGDEAHPNYRSRLVAKEFKTDVRPDLYAATPPASACGCWRAGWHQGRGRG